MLLKKTKSLCPVCLKGIEAKYEERDNKVYFEKTCPEHGHFSTLSSNNADLFSSHDMITQNIPLKASITKREKGCPFDCGHCEEHLQTPCCMLLEITDRCNQKCPYCFASSNEDIHNDPSLEEIRSLYERLIDLGEERKFNIQLSGGEPTVREDLPEIISMGRELGFEYIQLNTNGRRLCEDGYAKMLKNAGLSAVFLQFDGTNDDIMLSLRGEKLLDIKLRAIEACRQARLPVTLVPTIVKDVNTQNIGEMINFCLENIDTVKGIHFQPVSFFGRFPKNGEEYNRVTMFDIIEEINRQTGGKIKKESLTPLATGSSLCCFFGTFLKEQDGSIKPVHQKQNNTVCCDSPKLPASKIIAKDRDFIKNKWSLPTEQSFKGAGSGLDAFISEFHNKSFTLTCMQFQDILNIDLNRLKRCRVGVFSKEQTIIPFCAYNLTDANGNYIHRGKH